MRLPDASLSLQAALLEFDIWITPTLGEIRDTDRFREEMERIVQVFDALEAASNEFASPAECQPTRIGEAIVSILHSHPPEDAGVFLNALTSVLFLVTGKSDNNAKCQLPLFLRDNLKWNSIPVVRKIKSKSLLGEIPLPRELKADKFMGIVAGLSNYIELQSKLLGVFISFILNDEHYISQLWSIGKSYTVLKQFKAQRDLLSPLVVFQVRGSVAASGGHQPEELLRKTLTDWGMEAGIDFNVSDTVVTKQNGDLEPTEAEGGQKEGVGDTVRGKTRAYDFVLPFRTPAWKPRVFVQCQFYAGDSGSVSHKNVDQTSTSRNSVLTISPSAVFVEYVDGAGYFASLNGDLKRLLSMPNTKSFFQVRSAPIRLRRELQGIGFLLLIEIEHAILRCDGSRGNVTSLLETEGYSRDEISRAVNRSLEVGRLTITAPDRLQINAARRELARRYLLLDTVAREGKTIEPAAEGLAGFLIAPGYGPFHGLKMDDAVSKALGLAPQLKSDWSHPELLLQDIRWLSESGLVRSS